MNPVASKVHPSPAAHPSQVPGPPEPVRLHLVYYQLEADPGAGDLECQPRGGQPKRHQIAAFGGSPPSGRVELIAPGSYSADGDGAVGEGDRKNRLRRGRDLQV